MTRHQRLDHHPKMTHIIHHLGAGKMTELSEDERSRQAPPGCEMVGKEGACDLGDFDNILTKDDQNTRCVECPRLKKGSRLLFKFCGCWH